MFVVEKKAMLFFKSGFVFGFDRRWWERMRNKGTLETFIPKGHKELCYFLITLRFLLSLQIKPE